MSEIMRQLWTPQMQVAFTILILLIVALYALSIIWVGRDARLRGVAPAKWMIIALVPGAGIVAYLLLRPSMLAMDRDEQEMEVALKQRELMKYGECANCGYPVKDTYVLCPNCQTKLRNLCSHCQKPLEPGWPVCPYCATPIASTNVQQSAQTAEVAPRQTKTTRRRQATTRSTRPRKTTTTTTGSVSATPSEVARETPSKEATRTSTSTTRNADTKPKTPTRRQ